MLANNLTVSNISLIAMLAFSPILCGAVEESKCYGASDNGYLKNGWQLPSSGKNFSAYSFLGVALGRNYVHSTVHRVVLEAYKLLETDAPLKVFVYGESGFENGGKFRPHKTHQNGLSVDFFVPVISESGKSLALPTNPFNKFGYGIEFIGAGDYGDLSIDFPAMAQHLHALTIAAENNSVKIWRVIFDNELQKELFKTPLGSSLKQKITFSTKKPWVRHDEHYHIDFIVPCEPVN